MFKRLFNKKAKQADEFPKIDYWEKWKLFELLDDLHKGERLLIEFTSDSLGGQFLKFKEDYVEELHGIESDNVADFTRIWEWFAPTKEWEVLLGEKGKEIGRNVFSITDKWKRNQGFLLGTKVSLNNEFGVVIDKSEDWNEYGLIRWDTDKENDIEDWRGLFGSFLHTGGQIINQDHEFKFIDNDGTEKTTANIVLWQVGADGSD